MDYYKPVKIECAELIKSRTLEYMNQFKLKPFSDRLVYTKNVQFTEQDTKTINEEFQDKGLSKIVDVLSFKRWQRNKFHRDYCHLDGHDDLIYNASIVIPISGCKGTEQYWYDGDYEITMIATEGVKYFIPKWKTEGKLVASVSIVDTPMLCRVNIPHNAYSNGFEPRLTCTLRFEKNETFEEIYQKLSED